VFFTIKKSLLLKPIIRNIINYISLLLTVYCILLIVLQLIGI